MNVIHLLRIGEVEGGLLTDLQQGLASEFRMCCEVLPVSFDSRFAFHAERQQYHSTEILVRMSRELPANSWRVLGVTGLDLYIPILTFVFGEAQVGESCAVVSYHRRSR